MIKRIRITCLLIFILFSIQHTAFSIFPVDAGVQSFVSPVSGYNLNYYEPVVIKIVNYGSSNISNFPVAYKINNNTFTDTVKSTIASNGSVLFTFATRVDLSIYGNYNIKAYTMLAGDMNHSNDTANTSVANMVNSYCSSASTYIKFENIGMVKIGSYVNGSATPVYNNHKSIQTYVDYTTTLPPIKLIPDSTYTIEISQIHYTNQFNSCFINVFIDYNQDSRFDYYSERVFGMQTLVNQTTVVGALHVKPNAKQGISRMRIVMEEGADASTALPCGTYSFGETEDYNVLIYPYIKQDAGVVGIISPSAIAGEGENVPVKAVIKNYGSADITSMNVSFRLNEAAPVITVWTGDLKPAKTDTVTLPAIIIPVFTNNICAYTTLKGDSNLFNDQFCKSFYGNPKIDVGATALISPQPGSCFSSSETVIIKVKNFGSMPVDFGLHNMITTANITGIINVTLIDTIKSGILAVNDSINITFSNKVDMSAGGSYIFNAHAFINADELHSNDAMPQQSFSVFRTITAYPYVENFEDFIPGTPGTFADGWTSDCQLPDTKCNYRWQVNQGPTPDTATGPWVDHTYGNSTGKFVFIQADSVGGPAELISPCFDLTKMSNPYLSFWYHMAGKDINNLNVEVYTGSGWTSIMTINGAQQTYKDHPWMQMTIDISKYIGIVKIKFVATRGNGPFGDIAIDDISVYQPNQTDAGLYDFIQPQIGVGSAYITTSYAKADSLIPITVSLKNYGSQPFTALKIGYIADNSPAVIESWTGNLAPDAIYNYTFTNKFKVIKGNYQIIAFVQLANDNNRANDTIKINFIGVAPKSPYIETFESFPGNNSATLINNWFQEDFTNYQWKINSGPTGTPGTGPIVDHTLGTSLGKYIYTDAGFGNKGDIAYLLSTPIDLSVFKHPKLSFWIYFYGSDINEMQVKIFASGVWRSLKLIKGQIQTNQKQAWRQLLADLSAYKGIIRLRFMGVRGNGVKGDMAIDDVSIYTSAKIDAALQTLVLPNQFVTAVGNTRNVEITIENAGQDTIKTIFAAYIISGNKPVMEKWTGILKPDTTMNYKFITTYTVPPAGYNIKSFIEVLNDTNHTNDTLIRNFMGITEQALSYTDNFEGINYWYSEDPVNYWQHGIPASDFISSLATPVSGHDVWALKLKGGYNGGVEYDLYSPEFDFSNAKGAVLSFWQYMNCVTGNDVGRIMYSTVADSTWVTLGYIGDPNGTNWYNLNYNQNHYWNYQNNNKWIKSSYVLTQFNNYPSLVKFKFAFYSSAPSANVNTGWAIDMFSILLPAPKLDAGVTAIIEPSTYTPSGTPVQVKVQITNFGLDTLHNIPVAYQVDNGSLVTDTFKGTLLPDSQISNFKYQTPFIAKYAYNLCAFTQLPNDANPSNNQSCFYDDKDIGVFWIEKPISEIDELTQNPVSVIIKNYGIAEIDSAEITYTVNGVPQAQETWRGKLLPDSFATYTFLKPFSILNTQSSINLCAYTTMPQDANASNNKFCKTIDVTTITSNSQFSILNSQFSILNCYPNPVNDYTIIKYQTPEPADVVLMIYNIYGITIGTLHTMSSAGINYLNLKPLFSSFNLNSGVYYFTLTYKGQRLSKVLIKL